MTGIRVRDMCELTEREREIFDTYIDMPGASVRDVAEKLCISQRTLRSHNYHIIQKCGVKSIRAAIAIEMAFRNDKKTLYSVQMAGDLLTCAPVESLPCDEALYRIAVQRKPAIVTGDVYERLVELIEGGRNGN